MVNGGVQYRTQYAPPAVHPHMGAVGDMNWKSWSLLAGGAIVAAAGISGVVKNLPSRGKKLDVVAILIGGVVTLVGGTAFVDSFNRLTA